MENLEAQARRWLAGRGDPEAGEWTEVNGVFFHLRRRLTAEEARDIGPAVDIRGTWEATKRAERVRKYLPRGLIESLGEA